MLSTVQGLDERSGIYLGVGVCGQFAALVYSVSYLGGDVIACGVLVNKGEMAQAVSLHLPRQVGVEGRGLAAQRDGEFPMMGFSCQVGDIRAYHEVVESGYTPQWSVLLGVFLGQDERYPHLEVSLAVCGQGVGIHLLVGLALCPPTPQGRLAVHLVFHLGVAHGNAGVSAGFSAHYQRVARFVVLLHFRENDFEGGTLIFLHLEKTAAPEVCAYGVVTRQST